MKSKEKEQ